MILLCEWAKPSAPWSKGTLVRQHPWIQFMMSQSCSFSMCSLAHSCLAYLTAPLRHWCSVCLVSGSWASLRFCTAVVQAAFHQGAALGWRGCLLQNVASLVSSMSLTSASAATSISSTKGDGGSRGGLVRLQNDTTHASCFSRSITKLHEDSSSRTAILSCAWPFTQ